MDTGQKADLEGHQCAISALADVMLPLSTFLLSWCFLFVVNDRIMALKEGRTRTMWTGKNGLYTVKKAVELWTAWTSSHP